MTRTVPGPELPASTRIFGRFNQTGTKTGRLSSSDPNLQNIPVRDDQGRLGTKLRALFKGNLFIGDYSQLEPRLMAHFSRDPNLLDIYANNKDLYIEMAEAILGERITKDDQRRVMMKTYTLGLGYGAYEKTLQKTLAMNGFWFELDEVAYHLERMRTWLGVFFEWREAVIARVKRVGYVQTIGGRHRRLKAAFADRRNWKNVGYGERQAVNAIVQGSAGDIVRRTMMRWPYYMESDYSRYLDLILQVHDELAWEAQEEWLLEQEHTQAILNSLKTAAEDGFGYELGVPLRFDVYRCATWADKGTGIELEVPDDLNEESVDYEEAV